MTKLTDLEFEELIQQNIKAYKNSESTSARIIMRAFAEWCNSRNDWLAWWRSQNLQARMELQKFLFWLVRNNLLSIDVFGTIYQELTPVLSSLKTIPVSLVESGGTPKFEGGIISQEWSICNYKFTPLGEPGRWNMSIDDQSVDKKPSADLELVLSAISFDLHCLQSVAKLGFVTHHQQTFSQSVTESSSVGFGPTIHILPTIEPKRIELLVAKSQISVDTGLSIGELLRIRHRAISDNSLESKLIALWSAIEFEFGKDEQDDRLLADEQLLQIKAFLTDIQVKESVCATIIDVISKLKKKTKNDRIKESLNQLRCSEGHEINKDVSRIFNSRGRFAHGCAMGENEALEVLRDVTFLFAVVDEIIEAKLKSSS